MTDLLRTQPILWMEVSGQGRFEIAQFNSNFFINQIPRATVTFAVGRQAYDGITASRIHSKLNALQRATPVKVYAQFAGNWDDVQDWPEGTFKIFDGRILGIGYQKVNGKVVLSAYLNHWLADLNYTSVLHSRTHPVSDVDFAFPAIRDSLLGGETGFGVAESGASRNAIAASAEARFIRPDRLSDDLWGSTLKPFFCKLAQDTHVRITPDTEAACGVLIKGTDRAALNALRRIEGVSDFERTECDLVRSCYTKPLSLSLDSGDALPEEVAEAAAEAIGQESVEAFSSQTVWSKLLQYSNQFMFAIVPQVDKALVVPVLPGTRTTFCKTIQADEYAQISITGQVRRPIRALALITSYRTMTGIVPSGVAAEPPTIANGLGGCYAPADIADTEGMILFKRPPDWLRNVGTSGLSAARSTGRLLKVPAGAATMPAAAVPALRGTKKGKMIDEVLTEARTVFNGLAHALYVQETLRGRMGYIPGKLRFDIAPGSTVIIEGTTEKFIPDSEVGQNVIATVVGVGISIDAESPMASTTFQLNYCRTEQENTDDKTSLLKHPLYRGSPYSGAPLIPELWFPNDQCCVEEKKK